MEGADWTGAVGGDLKGAKWVSVLTWLGCFAGVSWSFACTHSAAWTLVMLKRDLRFEV